jgi:hypothetical protein
MIVHELAHAQFGCSSMLLAVGQAHDLLGSIAGERWDDVGAQVERDAHGDVAEALGHDLGMDARLQRQGCEGVAEIVILPMSA